MDNDKPILVNDYYVFNKTNNKYSTKLFTELEAIKAEKSNVNCNNCTNCVGCCKCKSCKDCTNCTRCHNSEKCFYQSDTHFVVM